MAYNANRTSIIVSQDGLIAFKISQLSPAISNAKVTVRVLRILPNHCSERGSSSRSTLLVVRDDEMTAAVCCWDFKSVVRANSLRFGDYIEIQYPDIRFRKNGVPIFPTTFCNVECVTSIVSVGAILVHLGEAKHSTSANGSTYRTHRLWDPSLSNREYINITLWDTNGEPFENAQIGDFVLAERVKVISFRSSIQLSSAVFSLYQFNLNLPQADEMRAAWNLQTRAKLESVPLPQLQRKPAGKAMPIDSPHIVEPNAHQTKKTTKKEKPRRKDSLITDFFHSEPPVHEDPTSSSSVSTEKSPFAIEPTPSFAIEQKRASVVLGRFSVADALQLKDNQSCWTVACLVELMARTPRGWCVYNCMACGKSVSDCICTSSAHSPVWSFDVCAEWRDGENSITIPLDNCLASQVLQAPAAIFVGWNESERHMCVDKAMEKTYKLRFEKSRGKTQLMEMVELPMFEED